MFSLTFKALAVFMTFLLFQSNLYVVLACGKGPKNNVHRDLFKAKNPKQKTSDTDRHLRFTCLDAVAFSLTDFSKCLKNLIFPKFVVKTLITFFLVKSTRRGNSTLVELVNSVFT